MSGRMAGRWFGANGARQQLGANGQLSFFSKRGGHVIADVTGYFLP